VRRAKWGKDDVRGVAQLGGIFIAMGAAFGLLRGDGVIIGMIAGALLFAIIIGVGSLVELIQRVIDGRKNSS
jgi:hypothetical protein